MSFYPIERCIHDEDREHLCICSNLNNNVGLTSSLRGAQWYQLGQSPAVIPNPTPHCPTLNSPHNQPEAQTYRKPRYLIQVKETKAPMATKKKRGNEATFNCQDGGDTLMGGACVRRLPYRPYTKSVQSSAIPLNRSLPCTVGLRLASPNHRLAALTCDQ